MIALGLAGAAMFNLSCSLHMSLVPSSDDPPLAGNYQRVLRIDLRAMRWCDAQCAETLPIVAATRAEIVLDRAADPRIDAYRSTIVNRESGRYLRHERINETTLDESGYCRRRPFTGFPRHRF